VTQSTITWLGDGSEDPSFILWNGYTFLRDRAVAIDDPWMLDKAQHNPYFRVVTAQPPTAAEPPPEPLPEMPAAPPLSEQLQVIKRKRGRPRKVASDADQ
jgi:hypothetical protein